MNIIYTVTKDQLQLQGIHYESEFPTNTCIVMIHGMSGNIIENYAFDFLGKELAKNGYAAIYGHNRGYAHINDIRILDETKEIGYNSKRIGATYEIFEECLHDIKAWIDTAESLGYTKIILFGHSLGANKIIYYNHITKDPRITKMILASPGDNVGQTKFVHENYDEILQEAEANIHNDEPRKILPFHLWDYFSISSQTFIHECVEECMADNLPVIRNPEHFTQLESITVPLLILAGEFDDIKMYDLNHEMEIMQQKAINAHPCNLIFIPGANHMYDKQEQKLADNIIGWIKNV